MAQESMQEYKDTSQDRDLRLSLSAKQLKWTITVLVCLVILGVLIYLETDKREPHHSMLRKLVEALEVELSGLLED